MKLDKRERSVIIKKNPLSYTLIRTFTVNQGIEDPLLSYVKRNLRKVNIYINKEETISKTTKQNEV